MCFRSFHLKKRNPYRTIVFCKPRKGVYSDEKKIVIMYYVFKLNRFFLRSCIGAEFEL